MGSRGSADGAAQGQGVVHRAPSRLPSADGRVARGERTRARVIAAHTALLRDGELRPTAATVAARAGVSVRALWLNFRDYEGLLTAASDHWLRADAELAEVVDPTLPLGERVTRWCAQRAARNEHLRPASRSAALAEPFSEALQRSRRRHLERLTGDLRATFGAELAAAGARDDLVLASLVLSTSAASWLVLRDDLGHTVAEATLVLEAGVAATLDGSRPGGHRASALPAPAGRPGG